MGWLAAASLWFATCVLARNDLYYRSRNREPYDPYEPYEPYNLIDAIGFIFVIVLLVGLVGCCFYADTDSLGCVSQVHPQTVHVTYRFDSDGIARVTEVEGARSTAEAQHAARAATSSLPANVKGVQERWWV
jgi:hypothetical protein